MATRSAAGRAGVQVPEYRTYPVRVSGHQRLGPSFVRVTFAGENLRHFGASGDDQRIKLVLPQPGRTVDDVPRGRDWYAVWQAMPDTVRPTMRTYTVRAHRPEAGEVDIDFVLHGVEDGHGGPASRWAATARLGERVALVGPDRPGAGRMWGREWAPPRTARRLLLAGDETAVPAVAAIVESMPRQARGIACLEVPTVGDVQSWACPPGVDVRWLVRERDDGVFGRGTLLEPTVAGAAEELCGTRRDAGAAALEDVDVDTALLWDVPGGDQVDATAGEVYGWLAGEAAVIKRLRRMLVHDHRVPRSSVAFMGYWREGMS